MTEKTKKEDKGDFEKIMSMTKVSNISSHDFISKKMREKLSKKFGKIYFPILGIAMEDKKQFIFLFHESEKSIKEKKAIIATPSNVTDAEIKKFIDFVKKNINGD